MNRPSQVDMCDLNENSNRASFYRKMGYWDTLCLLNYWNKSVSSFPEKNAVIDSHQLAMSFKAVEDLASRIAYYLVDKGVNPGDRISIQLNGWAEVLPITIACLKVGAVIIPTPTNFRFNELHHIFKECQPKVIFTPLSYKKFTYHTLIDKLQACLPSLETAIYVNKFSEKEKKETFITTFSKFKKLSLEASTRIQKECVKADDLTTILFTSGSEGFPKGVMLSHNNIIASEQIFAHYFNLSKNDILLMPAPIAHATGFLHGLILPVMLGATCVLQDEFNAKTTLELISQHKCTSMMASEPFLHDMLEVLKNTKYDISSLRFFLCGGSPVSQKIIEDAFDYGITTCNIYGSSESIGHMGTLPYMSKDKLLKTSGKPFPGVEVRVVDKNRKPVPHGVEGEEASRGPQVCLGYLNNPELTKKTFDEDGWYYSGDLCIMDEDGYIRITGRIKDVIVRGGENISSLEVENIMLRHPSIDEVAVVAMPDKRLHEKICAYLVLNKGVSSLLLEDIVAFMVDLGVAKCKCPEHIELVETLPRTASGKVKKEELRKDIINKMKIWTDGKN